MNKLFKLSLVLAVSALLISAQAPANTEVANANNAAAAANAEVANANNAAAAANNNAEAASNNAEAANAEVANASNNAEAANAEVANASNNAEAANNNAEAASNNAEAANANVAAASNNATNANTEAANANVAAATAAAAAPNNNISTANNNTGAANANIAAANKNISAANANNAAANAQAAAAPGFLAPVPVPAPETATPETGNNGPAAFGLNGTATPAANPNTSVTYNNTNINGNPTTLTTPNTSTSAFSLAQLQALEINNASSGYPTQNYTLFLADIHFYSGNLSSQYVAYHYCHFVSADFMQCALYNGQKSDSRFIGNEYFITQALFQSLPAGERNLWHAHPFEVQSGLFVAPDLSAADELEVMQWLMGTFGKVTDTWAYYEDFPLGVPKLGFALSLASQVNWTLATEMDNVLNLSTTYQQRQQQRAGLITPNRTAGADNYIFSGVATGYEIYSFPLENNGTVLGLANATGPAVANQTAPVTNNITLPASAAPISNLPTSSPLLGAGAFASLPDPNLPLGAA